jgi:hypothetical protein
MTGFRAMPHRTPAIVKPTGNRCGAGERVTKAAGMVSAMA